MYKHYSFDLWKTLIKSNPEFNKKRIEYFEDKFNPIEYSFDEVEKIVKDDDNFCNYACENTGNSIASLDMYAMVLYKLGKRDVNSGLVKDIQAELDFLFLQFPPTLYDNDTLRVLQALKSQGKTLSLCSNTGFIRGHTINQVDGEVGEALSLMEFKLYSDEQECSKPSNRMFRRVWEGAACLPKYEADPDVTNLKKSDIIHVGDSYVADIMGATKAGLNVKLINSLGISIKDLL